MEAIIYNYVLILSFPITFIMGMFFLTLRPPKKLEKNQLITYRLFGVPMIIWSLYIAMYHIFSDIVDNSSITIGMSVTRYYIIGSIYKAIYSSLLDNSYPVIKKLKPRFFIWVFSTILLAINAIFVPKNVQPIISTLAIAMYTLDVTLLLTRFFQQYYAIKNNADNFFSSNTEAFFKWMKQSAFGLGTVALLGAVLVNATSLGIAIFIAIGVILFIYMFYSFYNYTLDLDRVKEIISENTITQAEEEEPIENSATNHIFIILQKRIDNWIVSEGYLTPNLNIIQLASELYTNRTYLSSYINSKYNLSFKNWISYLKIEHSKKLLTEQTNLSINQIADKVDYSLRGYTTAFTKQCGMPPKKWRILYSAENIKSQS